MTSFSQWLCIVLAIRKTPLLLRLDVSGVEGRLLFHLNLLLLLREEVLHRHLRLWLLMLVAELLLVELVWPLLLLLWDTLEIDGRRNETRILLVHVLRWLVLQLLMDLDELLDDVGVVLLRDRRVTLTVGILIRCWTRHVVVHARSE